MNARTFRLAVSLVLALAAVALSGWSVVRKVQSFQPLGFTASPFQGGVEVLDVTDVGTGLEPGDQIVLSTGARSAARPVWCVPCARTRRAR